MLIPNQIMGERYSVIFYLGQFPTPRFGSLSTQSLIYTLIYLLFTPNYFSTVCHCVLSHTRCMNEGGSRVGLHGWRRSICGFACEIILARNLICQPDARC